MAICTLSYRYDLSGSDAEHCELAVHVAFSGEDSNTQPLHSGQQIMKLSDYSVTAQYAETSQSAQDQAAGLADQAQGAVQSAQDAVSI